MKEFLEHFLALALDAAPWLALGLLLGGLMKALIPTAWLEHHLKGDGLWPVVKAALLGAPLPLCSCGVVPAALGLRRAGASPAATTSFLVSTPETGIDSVSITYALLGPVMAIARPIAAIASAITAGLIVGSRGAAPASAHAHHHEDHETTACCSTQAEPEKTCCASTENCCSDSSTPIENPILDGIHYAFTDLLDDILPWLLAGLLFSAAVQTWVPGDFLARWGSGLPAMLIMVAISIPMYVCATASTPIAAGLMLSGISPGTVLVFLLAGPASNVGSLGIIRQELGQRATLAYLGAVIFVAIAAGLLLDSLLTTSGIRIDAQIAASDRLLPPLLGWISLGILAVTAIRKRLQRFLFGKSCCDHD